MNNLYYQSQVKSYCFPVSKRLNEETGKWYIRNDETFQKISDVSDRYELVPNKDVLMPFIEHFGIEALKRIYTWGRDKNMLAVFETGRQFEIGGNNDLINERIIIQNSYDKTRSFKFLMGALRTFCTNQLYLPTCAISYRKIHVGNIPTNSLITQAFNNYAKEDYKTWQRMATIPITPEQTKEIVTKIEPVTITEEELNKPQWEQDNVRHNKYIQNRAIRRFEVERKDLWGLYNAFNYSINYEFNSPATTARRINANNEVEEQLIKMFSLN